MKECPACRHCFPDDFNNCPTDGDALLRTITGDTVLDRRYQLDRRLGQGGMGIVFQARHIFLKTAYAIKVILPDLVGNDPMLVTRFRQEAMVAARISHRNIVNVTDFGVASGGMPYLVMEFIRGRSLQEVLTEQGRLSPERALEIMAAVCAGVGAAHREGIVHRDLKPLNIMLQDDVPFSDGVKVLDFGLAKIKSGEFLGSFVAAQTTGLMGSPFYMAPELWSDEEPDKRADVYSLGIILFQILTDDLPFKGSTVPAIMNKHLLQPPPSLSTRGVNLPAAIDEVLRHALAKKREDRLPTVEDFMNELREAVLSAHAGFVRVPQTFMDSQSVTMFLPEVGSGEIDLEETEPQGEGATKELILPNSQERIEHEADRLRHEFEEAQRRADEARQRADEAARRRAEEEAARRHAEEEAARKLAEEEAARKRAEEVARRQAEEEAARKRAEEKAARRIAREEARKRAEEEKARKLAAEEAARLAREIAEAQRRAEEARLLAEEEARRRTEEEAARLRAEEKARQLAAEVEEIQRRAEEARQRAEDEARKRAEEEEARKQAEAEMARERAEAAAKIHAEEEATRKRAAEEADRLALEIAEAQRRAEEARLRAEEEARKRVAEEEARKRAEEEARRLSLEVAEAQRRADEVAAKRAREEEASKQAAEKAHLLALEAERQRQADEAAAKSAEQERRARAEADAKRKREEAEYAAIERDRVARGEPDPLQTTAPIVSLTETMMLPSENGPPSKPGAQTGHKGIAFGTSRPTTVLQSRQPEPPQTWPQVPPMLEVPGPHLGRRKAQSALPIILAVAAGAFVIVIVIAVVVYQKLKPVASPSEAPPIRQGSPSATPAPSPSRSPVTSQVKIDGGTFQMGRNDVSPDSNETFDLVQFPEHPATVNTFWMDKTEVTNEEYGAFVRETKRRSPPHWKGPAPPPGQLQLPVTEVSLEDAQKFAAWRSTRDRKKYRLPTEEEWEYAARNGAQDTLYPWGNKYLSDRATLDSKASKTVGSYPLGACRWGVLDLIGNVWEWTSSTEGPYPGNVRQKPQPGRFVIRGGDYDDKSSGGSAITATRRWFSEGTSKDGSIGFRLVSDEP